MGTTAQCDSVRKTFSGMPSLSLHPLSDRYVHHRRSGPDAPQQIIGTASGRIQ